MWYKFTITDKINVFSRGQNVTIDAESKIHPYTTPAIKHQATIAKISGRSVWVVLK